MKVFASQLKGRKVKLMDLDTKKPVKGGIWVDEAGGLCEAYVLDDQGRRQLTLDSDGAAAWKTVLLKGRFKLVFDEPSPARAVDKVKMGAPACARCGSPLTLMGDDLCPACKAKDRGKPIDFSRTDPFEFQRCEKCSRDATWSVSDECEVTPQRSLVTKALTIPNGSYLFDRSMTVGRRYYCDRHFQPPRLVDAKGEPMADLETNARPG